MNKYIKNSADDEKTHHLNLINEFKKILDEVGAGYENVVIGGSAILGGLGLKKINDLDVNVGAEEFEKLKKHPDAVIDEKRPGTWRIRFQTDAGEIEVFSSPWIFGEEDYMAEGTPTTELQGIKHWAPEHALKWKKFMNRPKDKSDIELLEKQIKGEMNFKISKRADFADEVLEDLGEKFYKAPASVMMSNVGDIDVNKLFEAVSYLESGGKSYTIGDAGTSFGPTQVHGPYFLASLANVPNIQEKTGIPVEEFKKMSAEWMNAKNIINKTNIWKTSPISNEVVNDFVMKNTGSIIHRLEGTFIRYTPESIIKKVGNQYVLQTLDLDKLRQLGLDVNNPTIKNNIDRIVSNYLTENVLRSALAQLFVSQKTKEFSKFKEIFSSKNIRNNKNISNIVESVSRSDFMGKVRAVNSYIQKSGYNTNAPGAFNIYQLIMIANASGHGRVREFLINKKPFAPGNLHYIQSSRFKKALRDLGNRKPELRTVTEPMLAGIPADKGMGGFKTALLNFSLSKRAEDEYYEEEPTQIEINREIYQIYNDYMKRFKDLTAYPEFLQAVKNKIGEDATPIEILRQMDNSITKFLTTHRDRILSSEEDLFPEFPNDKWDIVLKTAGFNLSKRAEYTEPGVLYFPGNYAEDIRSGKRQMTIRAGDVPVEADEIVKCKTYSGAHICDVLVLSKEIMSLSRIEKAYGERIAKSLEQKFGPNRRFVVVKFENQENYADDGDFEEIDFPEEEHKELERRLRKGKGIYTTRISKERGKYKEEKEYMTPWGHRVKVVNIVPLKGIENHPFLDELTEEQKNQIGNHKYDLIRLEKVIEEKAEDEDDKKWDEVLIDKDGVKLTRKQIKNHYLKTDIRKKIMSRIKDNPILIYIGTGTNQKILKRNHNNKQIVITNDDPEKKDSPNNYFYWVERRLLAIHQVFGTKTELGFVDLDIHGDYPIKDAKKYAKEVSGKIREKFGVGSTTYESGGTGLHIEFELKEAMNINTLRAELKEMLEEINKNWDKVSTGIIKGKGMRSDVSTLHNKGSLRVPGSLGETYGKVKKPLGIEQDGDDDTNGNTNFGKYTGMPDNLDEDPNSLDTGALPPFPGIEVGFTGGVGNYIGAGKKEELIKEGKRSGVKEEWLWGFGDGRFITALNVKDEKELHITHLYMFDNEGIEFIDDDHNPRGFITFYKDGKIEVSTYNTNFRKMPLSVQNKVEERFGLVPGKFEISTIDAPKEHYKEMVKEKYSALKFASGLNNPEDWKKAEEHLQNIWKIAGILEDDEAEWEKALEKAERGGSEDEEEDEASRWLAEQDEPKERPKVKEPKQMKETKIAPEPPKKRVPKKTIMEQIKGEVPEELKSKKDPEKKEKRHKRERKEQEEKVEMPELTFEDLFGAREEKKEEPKKEEPKRDIEKEQKELFEEAFNSKIFEEAKAEQMRKLEEDGKSFHSSVNATPEELVKYLIKDDEKLKAEEEVKQLYVDNLATWLSSSAYVGIKDLPLDLIKKEIKNHISASDLRKVIETGRTPEDVGAQFAVDDMLNEVETTEGKKAKPTFTARLTPPMDEKGQIAQSWPQVDAPNLKERALYFFHPDNLTDGPSIRKVFANPEAWEVLKVNPELLQKWILPAIIMAIGHRWFEINSAKDYVGQRAEKQNALTFKHLQGGAPFSMLESIVSEEIIKKLDAGEISISDIPEAKEYIQHINRITTDLVNVYFSKEKPSIPIDEYIYKGLQNEMTRIVAAKNGFRRKHAPKCSICLAEADERTETEAMVLVEKGLYKCPSCMKVAEQLESNLVDVKKELQDINKRLLNYEDAKRQLTEEVSDRKKEKIEEIIKNVEPHLKRFNTRKGVLEQEIKDTNAKIRLRTAQSRVPYFHTLCPNPNCKLQRVPLTSIDWEDSIWKTEAGHKLKDNLRNQYSIENPMEQGAEELTFKVPTPDYVSKSLIPSGKVSWIYYVPFRCPYDNITFKMKDVIGKGYRNMAGFFYYPHEKIIWESSEEKSRKMAERDPQLDPTNKAAEVGDLKVITDRAQKSAQQQYYEFYNYLRMMDSALKKGEKEIEIEGKTYPVKPLTAKQKSLYARKIFLYDTIKDFVSSDAEAYLNWLSGSAISSKPIYEDGKVSNRNVVERTLSYSDKREQIYLPILQKWVDKMMKKEKLPESEFGFVFQPELPEKEEPREGFMKKFGIEDWLVKVGKPQPDGSYSEEGIPSDGPGTYFVAKVINSSQEESGFYGFTCNLESKRTRDEKYKKHYDKKGPRILRVLDVFKLSAKEINALTVEQKEGKEAVEKEKAEIIKKNKENLVPEVKNHDFHKALLNDNITQLVPGDYVMVRALIMPGKFYFGPIFTIQEVEKNKRDREFWEKFYELIRLKKDEPRYWKEFEEKVSNVKPFLHNIEDIINREIFNAKSKKQAEFQLSIRIAKDPLAKYKSKRDFDETSEPEGKVEKTNKHRFVIQDHEALHHHWDLRLENDEGSMSSWAIPKFHLPKEKEKLLAMKVEDHPISYNKFEGKIPEGEYGAGEVKIVDSGTYEEIEWSKNKIIFKLKGEGTFNLIRTDGQKWLLSRSKEE